MGLTAKSTGKSAIDGGLVIHRAPGDKVIALAGNPNVGKSTVFNELTGMKQHTGNWPGKTVSNAQGHCQFRGTSYTFVDIPGTYSLMAHSAEEEVARDFVCFGEPDAVVVVCDATCLERNLNLVLQMLEITRRVVVCVNLMDEAKKKQIQIDFDQLSRNLGVPVVGTSARSRKGLEELMKAVETQCRLPKEEAFISPDFLKYTRPVEKCVSLLLPLLEEPVRNKINPRWVALRLLEGEKDILRSIDRFLGVSLYDLPGMEDTLKQAEGILLAGGLELEKLKDVLVSCIVLHAEEMCSDAVFVASDKYAARDRRIDRILTSKITGIPLMLLLLCVIFWLTISGANVPSQLLADGLFWIQDRLSDLFVFLHAPDWLHGALVLGVYRVLAWVVSVMLPPMAIFFPLFTLLEDLGYLPRVAFNLDKYFKKACTCGKQALTMAMGFGCNAAGVVGCRIIDSPRERLIATITNSFVPCNGRFPTMIAIISMFFIGSSAGFGSSLLSAVVLTAVILLGILMTLFISRLLSKTVLKGVPSSFTLELPPYRRPQIGKVIVRSIFDRTLFVLGRAAAVAAPAGLFIWIMANVMVGDMSLLAHCSAFLDPFAHLLGMDGVILMAFILGFPANEVVFPIIIMAYMAGGTLTDMNNLSELHTLLTENGWTPVTAICTLLFSLMHWPCSTTCMTIHKETASLKWTAASILIPTAVGMTFCFLVATAAHLCGIG